MILQLRQRTQYTQLTNQSRSRFFRVLQIFIHTFKAAIATSIDIGKHRLRPNFTDEELFTMSDRQ